MWKVVCCLLVFALLSAQDSALAQEDFAPADTTVFKTPAPAPTLLDQVQAPVETTPPTKRSNKFRKFLDNLADVLKSAISGGVQG
ncbi:hypothetical protein ElyMa_006017500 [Elysia marginata]|uniref:Uncharacterized protein n=1 Tax=Elysia marginata TaxID=1093978 RepID=A0AAV4GH34_9GAST|nr:hypothetical protein ElyMa_006017500 [Elysia marginata]